MKTNKKLRIVLLSFIISTFFIYSSVSIAVDFVKKSSSGICHDKNSQYFAKTKKYIKYKTKYVRLLGGAHSDKSRTFDDFIEGLQDSKEHYLHWKNNLI